MVTPTQFQTSIAIASRPIRLWQIDKNGDGQITKRESVVYIYIISHAPRISYVCACYIEQNKVYVRGFGFLSSTIVRGPHCRHYEFGARAPRAVIVYQLASQNEKKKRTENDAAFTLKMTGK